VKKHINLATVLMVVIALASLVAAVKLGHPVKGGNTYGFSSGG
jgi:hypothetical protein